MPQETKGHHGSDRCLQKAKAGSAIFHCENILEKNLLLRHIAIDLAREGKDKQVVIGHKFPLSVKYSNILVFSEIANMFFLIVICLTFGLFFHTQIYLMMTHKFRVQLALTTSKFSKMLSHLMSLDLFL